MKATGGNLFVDADATLSDVIARIVQQLDELEGWFSDTDCVLDVGSLEVTTTRIPSGRISVNVSGDPIRAEDGAA